FPLPLSMISFASFLFHSYADLRALHSFPTRRSSDLAVSRTLTLFTYKLRFFFGPALRGRFGPLAYFGLILIFLPSGFAFGVTLGTAVVGADTATAIGVLAGPLAGLLSFGLLYALGAGVTAHASEFDF